MQPLFYLKYSLETVYMKDQEGKFAPAVKTTFAYFHNPCKTNC